MPPDYDKLPTPGNEEVSPETFSEDNEVKDILDIQDSSTSTEVNKDTLDVESTIIEKIQ